MIDLLFYHFRQVDFEGRLICFIMLKVDLIMRSTFILSKIQIPNIKLKLKKLYNFLLYTLFQYDFIIDDLSILLETKSRNYFKVS